MFRLLLLAAGLALALSPLRAQTDIDKPNIILIISDDHRFDAVGAAGNAKIKTPNLDRLAENGFYFRQATIHTSQCTPSRSVMLSGLPPHQNGIHSNQANKESDWSKFFKSATLPQILQQAGYHTLLSGKWHVPADPWKIGFSEVRYWLPGGATVYKDPSLSFGNSRDRQKVNGFTNEIFADQVVSFLKSPAAKDKPFFVWYAATAPHGPNRPNPKHIVNLYKGKSSADLLPPGFPSQYKPGDFVPYYESVSFLDELVGRVMNTLEETQLNKKTIVLFVGDNGYMMGSRGLKGKVNPYEESVRVPFIVQLPGKKGMSVLTPVSSLDIPPTILSFAGIKPPGEWPGRSFAKDLLKQKDPEFDYAISEWADNRHLFPHFAHRLIRTPEYKLLIWEDPLKPNEFYDLKNDPHETKNLFDVTGKKKEQKKLHDKLLEWMKKTHDPALNWKKR